MKKIIFLLILPAVVLFFSSPIKAAGNQPMIYKDGQVLNWQPANVPASRHVFHLITHGRPGELLMEGQWRNAEQILAFIQQKQLLSAAVRQLNIYGCEFAKNRKGAAAVQYLQQQLGITVAASVNITGVDGDYFLETGNVDAMVFFENFTGNLQCPGTKGGNGPGDDFDGDGICNETDLDDDNDGVPDETEDKCSGAVLNVTDYSHSSPSSSVTDMGNGVMVTTSFSTIAVGGVSINETAGTAVGDLIYHFSASQSDTAAYYYISTLEFDRPVRVLLGFPGTEAPGTHNSNDYITFATPGSNTSFVLYNPDSAISVLKNVPGEFRYHPNTVGNAEIPNINNRREYFVETLSPVTKIRIRAASTASDRINHVSMRVLIRACDTLDTDNDGHANQFDLDSDNDGCYDTYEASVPGATKGSGSYSDSVAVNPSSPAVGNNGYANNLETYADSDTANFTDSYTAYAESAELIGCADTDNDDVANRNDIDKDNDGILDTEEGAGCGTATKPFTSLEQARANVADPGVYHFNLSGNSFQTYVDTGGYVMIAIDYGDGLGVLPYSTRLSFNKAADGRGLLDTTTLDALGDVEAIRISSNSQEKGGVDVITTNDTLIRRLKASQSLHRGLNDNMYNNDWVGKNQEYLTNDATRNSIEMNSLRHLIVDPIGSPAALVWWPARNFQRVYWQGQEVLPHEYHALWVRGGSTGVVCTTDTDEDNIPNHLDTDSDGDGCSDASETSITGTLLPGMMVNNSGVIYSPKAIAQGPYGANGFANALETGIESGVYNGSYTDYNNAVNDAIAACAFSPRPRLDVNMAYENTAISGDLSTNDSVAAGAVYGPVTVMPGYTNPTAAIPLISSDGSYTFITTAAGVYKFHVPVCPSSSSTGCQPVLLRIEVLDNYAETNKPVVTPDVAITKVNSIVTLKTVNNDRSGNSYTTLKPSTVTITDGPVNGKAVIDTATGNITYTPFSGFTGQDTVTYTVCDDKSPVANCNKSYQVITVLPSSAFNSNIASDDYLPVARGVGGSGNVLLNDIDPDNDSITVTAQNKTVTGVGTFILQSNGSYSFSPEIGFSGAVNFPYELRDNGSPEAYSKATLYILVSSSIPLSLELLTFTASKQNGNAVILRWTTANEVNTSHFVIERMQSGSGHWQPIGRVNTTGNGNTSINSYYFRDNGPAPGANYYRLKQVDLDESYEYSSVRLVSFANRKEDITIYPNPADDYVTVAGRNLRLNQLRLYDMAGQQLDGRLRTEQVSPTQVRLKLYGLKPGTYILKMDGQAVKLIKK